MPEQHPNDSLHLRVKNLPGVLSSEAVASLLSHYGAADVKLLKDVSAVLKAKRAPQSAIATFRTSADRESALVRLSKLQLAGHHVRAELIGDVCTVPETQQHSEESASRSANVKRKAPPPLPKGPPPPLPPAEPVSQRAPSHSYYTAAPLAPHLGLHFAPSPLLEYKYPKASEAIVRNIANGEHVAWYNLWAVNQIANWPLVLLLVTLALIALPKFYTQVLHLMNKMNLPPPFDARAIPGIFSKDREEKAAAAEAQRQRLVLKRKFSGAQRNSTADFTIEEEEEDEEEEEEDTVRQSKQSESSQDAKRQRVNDTSAGHNATTSGTILPQPQLQQPSHVVSLPWSTTTTTVVSVHTSKAKRPAPPTIGITRAFENIGKGSNSNHAVRPGVISEAELNRQRLPLEELKQYPAMATYIHGAAAPSRSLLVRNLAESVDEQDLAFVFGHVLPLHMELSVLEIKISPASGTATIAFPTEALASEALDKIHGVVLETLPLLVGFEPSDQAAETMPAPVASRPPTLSLDELDSRRLEPSAFEDEKFMRNYQRGEPSATLYVKNLAKDIDERDLLAVFGAVVPEDVKLSEVKIRHFTDGRMKCQAFIEYPSVSLAAAALETIHGVVLKDKPLIVCFRKAPVPSSDVEATSVTIQERP